MRHRPDTVMLFAAGFGTRMAPLTDTRPKPLIEVAGRPLLDHALDVVRDAGLRRVVANTHYMAGVMGRALAERGVTVVHEPAILDTGGGVRNALPLLGDRPVLTLNADAVWTGTNPVTGLLDKWDETRMDALLLLVPPDRATGHLGKGDFVIDGAGRLTRGAGLIYTGLQVMKTAALNDIEGSVFSLNRVWDRMQADGRLFGTVFGGGWCDVGRPESIALAEAMLGHGDV